MNDYNVPETLYGQRGNAAALPEQCHVNITVIPEKRTQPFPDIAAVKS